MSKDKRTALDLTHALKRYKRMKPENAYTALWKEWPANIAAAVEGVMWSKIKSRNIEDIAQETAMLMQKAGTAYTRIQAAKRRLSGQQSKKQNSRW